MNVWKLAPYEAFEVKAIEGWMDEMSRNSLQFIKRYGPICIFERKNAPTRYRVDLRRKSDCDRTDAARFALYREMGWEYCCDYGGRAEIYRAECPDATELHTDAEVLGELVRSCCRDHLVMCCSFAIQLLYIIHSNMQLAQRWNDQSSIIWSWASINFFIACGAFGAALLLTILLTLIRWLRLKRCDYRYEAPHTPRRARRGAWWLLVLLVLIGLFLLYIPFTILTFLL